MATSKTVAEHILLCLVHTLCHLIWECMSIETAGLGVALSARTMGRGVSGVGCCWVCLWVTTHGIWLWLLFDLVLPLLVGVVGEVSVSLILFDVVECLRLVCFEIYLDLLRMRSLQRNTPPIVAWLLL